MSDKETSPAAQPNYYRPPEQHADEVRKMVLWLSIFFVGLTLLVVAIVFYADRLAQHLPFSAEKRFVRPYEAMADLWQQQNSDVEVVERQQVIEDYLQHLAHRLAIEMQLPDDYELQVHYLESDSVNAFATLGGHIFVFKGLLQQLPDENSLAMVMAHEIAHIQHRDPATAMGRGLALQMLYSFISGDYSTSGGLVLQSDELGLLMFSREQESAADVAAIHALRSRYGHVQGFDTLFRRLREETDEDSLVSDIPQWLSSHPALLTRIQNLQQLAQDNHWPEWGEVTPIPDEVILSMNRL